MLRKPRRREEKVIRMALRAFGSEDFLNENVLLVKDGDVKEVYALSKDLAKFLELYRLNFVSAGIKVGEVGSRRFRFSLEGSFFLVKRVKKSVFVNGKGEMLFLYGRDIFPESILDVTDDVEENDIVFVRNVKGDVIGIGRARFGADRIKNVERGRVVVENLVDRGEYLRKEKTYSSF